MNHMLSASANFRLTTGHRAKISRLASITRFLHLSVRTVGIISTVSASSLKHSHFLGNTRFSFVV